MWANGQPSVVKRLPTDLRRLVRQAGKHKKGLRISSQKVIEFESRKIECVDLEKEDDLPEPIRGRIELPFVSKGATWIGRRQGTDLFVVTFPPPPTAEDTVKVRFGPGLQAYLEYKAQNDNTKRPNEYTYAEDYV
jgi:hypothetical protein